MNYKKSPLILVLLLVLTCREYRKKEENGKFFYFSYLCRLYMVVCEEVFINPLKGHERHQEHLQSFISLAHLKPKMDL